RELLDPRLSPLLVRKKTLKDKPVAWEPGSHKCRHEGGRSRECLDLYSCLNGCTHQKKTWIRDPRRSGIRHQRDVAACLHSCNQLGRLRPLVVIMIACKRRLYVEVSQESTRSSSVFAGNDLNLLQHTQRTKRDVFQIS